MHAMCCMGHSLQILPFIEFYSSIMKIAGHPLHVMLIHFPSALFPMDFVCSLLDYRYPESGFEQAAFYALSGAVITGILAIITGAFDLLQNLTDTMLVKKILVHGIINAVVVTVYGILWMFELRDPSPLPGNFTMLIIKGILILAMFAGNYFGGNLIFKEGMGVTRNKF